MFDFGISSSNCSFVFYVCVCVVLSTVSFGLRGGACCFMHLIQLSKWWLEINIQNIKVKFHIFDAKSFISKTSLPTFDWIKNVDVANGIHEIEIILMS